MRAASTNERPVNTVVIGGGQAGLATAQQLRRRGCDFVILDAGHEVGASWRQRWDSLRLFTPAGFSHLPGMAFPGARAESPTKDAMADYLSSYADHFGLPIELDTRVEEVRRDDRDLLVTAADGRRWCARNAVVATSAHSRPVVPVIATALDPQITQLHSSAYRHPDQLPDGPVLVVGAGNSGAEIALDLTGTTTGGSERLVYLAGRDVGHIPPLGTWTYPLMQALGRAGTALSERGLRGGAEPLGRVRPGALEAAGIHRLPRVAGVRGGRPLTDDGTTVEVDPVVWCTGLRPDHRFLHLPVFDTSGRLVHRRGVTAEPGLYVVGMPHQSSITSHLVGGVGKDAAHVVNHLVRCPS